MKTTAHEYEISLERFEKALEKLSPCPACKGTGITSGRFGDQPCEDCGGGGLDDPEVRGAPWFSKKSGTYHL